MQIFVRNLLTARGGTIIALEVESSDTIASLMAQLEDRLGVPPIMQRIVCNSRLLYYYDAGTLADHKIRKESRLDAMYNMTSSSCYAFKVETLKSLGVDVERADDAVDKMQIFVRDCMIPCGRGRQVKTIVLEVEASDTVARVMVQVQGRLGYPPALQSLFYNDRRLLHDSGGTLADYNVREGSVLKLDMYYDGARAMIEARKIKESEGLPPVQQQEELTNDKTVEE